MARRTLSSSWKQIEKLVQRFEAAPEPRTAELEALADLIGRVNASKIADAIATLFVCRHTRLENTSVAFIACDKQRQPVEWITRFCASENTIFVSPLAVFRFYRDCQNAATELKTRHARESFQNYRYMAYIAELGKLPSQLLLFLLVLREVAIILQLSAVEKKGGEMEAVEGEDYLHLRWSFNEMEQFYSTTQGVNLRSEYGILWHESDWIVGK